MRLATCFWQMLDGFVDLFLRSYLSSSPWERVLTSWPCCFLEYVESQDTTTNFMMSKLVGSFLDMLHHKSISTHPFLVSQPVPLVGRGEAGKHSLTLFPAPFFLAILLVKVKSSPCPLKAIPCLWGMLCISRLIYVSQNNHIRFSHVYQGTVTDWTFTLT